MHKGTKKKFSDKHENGRVGLTLERNCLQNSTIITAFKFAVHKSVVYPFRHP